MTMKPTKASLDEHFAEMRRLYGPHFVTRMQDILSRAGCPNPERASRILRELVAPSTCHNNEETSGNGFASNASSGTVSDYWSDTDLHVFRAGFHEGLVTDVNQMLAKFPPDNKKVFAVLDGREREYWRLLSSNKGLKISPRARAHYLEVAHADNKSTPSCTKYVSGVVFWFHDGQLMVNILLHDLERFIGSGPKDHVSHYLKLMQSLDVKPSALIMDAWYSSHDVRAACFKAGIEPVIRVPLSWQASHHIYDANGKRVGNLRSVVTQVAKDKSIRPRETFIRNKKGERIKLLTRTATVRVRLEPGEPEISLLVRAAMKTNGGHIQPDFCFIVMLPSAIGIQGIVSLYGFRWEVEVTHLLVELQKPNKRPKTIHAEYIQEAALVYRVALGRHAKSVLKLNDRHGRLHGLPLRRWSICALAMTLLGHERVWAPVPDPT